jgi:hypothetical protein
MPLTVVLVRQSSSFASAWADVVTRWVGRASRPSWRGAACVIAMAAALSSTSTRAQSVTPTVGDPKKCVVILDGMGDVGFRISDAGIIADGVITTMRKRVGFEGAHYAGVAESAAAMKKMLKTPEGAAPQDAQLEFFKQCEANAPWRIKARFGTSKKKGTQPHWVTVSCRKSGSDAKDAKDPKSVVEEKKFEAKTFLEARDAMVAALPTFCGAIPAVGIIPVEPAPGTPTGPNGTKLPPPKEVKPWTPPPRRD